MNDEIEPKEDDRVAIKPPKISCDKAQAKVIMEEIGMGALSREAKTDVATDVRPPDLNDLIRLGAFVEGSGVVPLDHGAILVTRQVMLRQMVRLETLAQTLTSLQDVKDMTYAMGYLGSHIGKISTIGIKTKVAAELAADELRKKKQPSWESGAAVGTAVQAQPGSTVNVYPPANAKESGEA